MEVQVQIGQYKLHHKHKIPYSTEDHIAHYVPEAEMLYLTEYNNIRIIQWQQPTLELCTIAQLSVVFYSKHRRVFYQNSYATVSGLQMICPYPF